MGSTLKGKNLLLKEHLSEMGRGGGGGWGGAKMKIKELLPLNVYQFILTSVVFFMEKRNKNLKLSTGYFI